MKIRYEAEDGKIFATEEECLKHDYEVKVNGFIAEVRGAFAVTLEYFNGEMLRAVEVNEELLYELIIDFVKKEGNSKFIRKQRYEDEQKKVIGRMGL